MSGHAYRKFGASRSFLARCGIPLLSIQTVARIGKKVEVRGIPYLAKNERDMWHPGLVEGKGLAA
jgi:hypothetical protein